jgi:hypothetical protein
LSQAFISKRKVTGTHLINGILYAIQIVFWFHSLIQFWDMEISQRRVKPA